MFSYEVAHLERPGGREHALARHLDDEDRICARREDEDACQKVEAQIRDPLPHQVERQRHQVEPAASGGTAASGVTASGSPPYTTQQSAPSTQRSAPPYGDHPGGNRWFLYSNPIQMLPPRGGICGRLT